MHLYLDANHDRLNDNYYRPSTEVAQFVCMCVDGVLERKKNIHVKCQLPIMAHN